MRSVITLLIVVLAGAGLVGCGSSDESQEPDVKLVEETIHPLPKLDRGHEAYVSRSRGLAFGRPPGWDAKERDRAVEVRAPDRLVVLSLSADRTNEALADDLEGFPGRVFSSLDGYGGSLDPSEPRPFKHKYEAFQVTGQGVAAASGLKQNLRVIVLRRDGVAVITAVIAENADVEAPAEVREALGIVSTVRTRPPRTAPPIIP